MSTIYDWSLTPGDNATADSDINWAEGMFPSSVNNSAREMMTRVAEYIKDNGVLDALGTNTIAITSNSPITAITSGMTLAFRAAATNTTAVTLNLNGLGGKDIRKVVTGGTDSVALSAGDINIKGVYVVHYDATTNAGAGGWILLNPAGAAYLPLTGGTLTGSLELENTNPGATGSTLALYHNSASPAPSDILGSLAWSGKDSAGNKQLYAQIHSDIVDPTSGSEDSLIALDILVGGTLIRRLTLDGSGASLNGNLVVGGAVSAIGSVTSSQNFQSSTVNVVIGPTGAGGVFLRPNGPGSSLGEAVVNSTGVLSVASDVNAGGSVRASSAVFQTNADLNGTVWTSWGSASAFTAISAQIEARGAAYSASAVASAVAQARAFGGVGVDQSWTNLGLANNTWATNTTGQPIMIAILGGSGCDIFIAVNNDAGAPARVASSPSGTAVAAVIPAGAGYKYIASGVGYTGWVLS